MKLKNHFVESSKKKLLGLKSKVATREAVVVTASAALMFANSSLGFDANSLLLIPVFCIIVTCTISVWNAILNGATIIYATLISSLYNYLVFLIVPADHFWISFIILFFLTFVVAATAIGRRWFNQLTVKKILLDVIVLLYFSPRPYKNMQIWHNLVVAIMIGGSIVVVGLIVHPYLATRLFSRKIIKTLNSTRIYFRGVGYQMEASAISHNETTLRENSSFCFPIFPEQFDSDNDNILEQEIELESSMEDGDINLSPLPKRANDNNNNQSDRITIDNEHAPSPLNQTINIIPPPPQNMVIDIPTTNDIIIDKNIQQSPLNQTSNNIPPPPTSPLSPPTTLLMETPITIPTNNNENSNIELDPIGEMKAVEISIAEEQRQSISKDKRKSFKRIMNVFGLVSREKLETMDDGTILKKSLPLSRSTALEKDLFTKKMGKKQILATAIPLPSEKEIKHWENKLTDQINRLTTLLAECRQERWNAPLISSYEKLLSLLEMNQKQLISIKLSVNHGFSVMARQEVIFPVLPFLDSIIEEVFLQIGLIIHILVHRIKKENNANQADQLYTTILQQSFEETEALVEECRNTYKKIVKEYQRTNLPALRATEITKVHFFIFGISLFALNQRQIADNIYDINAESHNYHPSLEIIRYGFPIILLALPNYCIKRAKLLVSNVKTLQSTEPKLRVSTLISWILNYFYGLWFINKKWKFPLQLAVALTSAVAPFYYYEGRSYHELVIHGIWVCATVILVMSPTLGATITRGFHRIVGTIIGAILGFFISWLVHVVPQPAKQFILIITTFVFVFIASFVQQDVRFSYAGAVAALTFMIISFGSYLAPTFTYTMAVERAFNISLGIVWVLIISVVLFPYFTYKNSRLKFFDATSTMANTFIKIVELGLPTNSDQLANRAKIKGEITGSLRQIRVIMATQKSLLFDIRSELALQPKKSSSHYFKLIGDLSKLYTRLVAFDNAFDYQFSEAMVEAMAPIQQSIHDLNETLILSIDDLRALMHDQERTLERGTSRSLTDCLTELDNSFQAVRRDLLQKKTLFNLHPEMIQFGSGMYSLRDFIKHFIVVLKDFEMIKRDQFQQQHGSIKKPFINRLCDC